MRIDILRLGYCSSIFVLVLFVLFTIYSVGDVIIQDWICPPVSSKICSEKVLEDLASGRPVLRRDFARAFEEGLGSVSDVAVRRVADKVGLDSSEVLQLIKDENTSVTYTGPSDKIPLKLRPTSRSVAVEPP